MNTTLRENIDWVGCVDWTIRDFHGYNTDRGSTYMVRVERDAAGSDRNQGSGQ